MNLDKDMNISNNLKNMYIYDVDNSHNGWC